jgi:hypothetical protein
MELRHGPKPYRTDHGIVYSCQYHVICCPKYCHPMLVNAVAARLKELVLAKQDKYGHKVLGIKVMLDHQRAPQRGGVCRPGHHAPVEDWPRQGGPSARPALR